MNVYVKSMLGVRTNASGVRRLHLPGHRTPAYVRRSWGREAALRTNLALRPEKGSVHAAGRGCSHAGARISPKDVRSTAFTRSYR